MAMVLNRTLTPCIDCQILEEYREVLARPAFGFDRADVNALISFIQSEGLTVVPSPLFIDLPDASDKKFLEMAEHLHVPLITGNTKHFPRNAQIKTPAEFLYEFFG
jgi:predicted nucleic acid-binding protein